MANTDQGGAAISDGDEAVVALMEAAERHGRVDLLDLDTDAEHVVSGGVWQLTDATAWTAWCELDPERRGRRALAALRRMVESGAVREWTASEDGQDLNVDASGALRLVAAARTDPDFVVDVVAEGVAIRPRCFALGDGERCRGVVVDLTDGATHSYRLLTPERAVAGLARWVRSVLTDPSAGQHVDAVTLVGVRRGGIADGVVTLTLDVDPTGGARVRDEDTRTEDHPPAPEAPAAFLAAVAHAVQVADTTESRS